MPKELTKADWLGCLDRSLIESRSASRRSWCCAVPAIRGSTTTSTRRDSTTCSRPGRRTGCSRTFFIGRHRGLDVGYASLYGGPMASEIAHLFGVRGTRLVVRTGVCGGLGDGIEAGALVIATEARCAEGAAAWYPPGVKMVAASAELVAAVMADPTVAVPRHTGLVWTTAVPLAEGRAEIDHWHAAGDLAADMETASTFAVAEVFGMRRLSLLSAFDDPRQRVHLRLTEAAKDAARAPGEREMLRLLLALIERNGGDRPEVLPVAPSPPGQT